MKPNRVRSDNWSTRLVLINLIVCTVLIVILFSSMELIVHGQLYYYGLRFSPDWADPYRIYTWLIYLSLIVPMALSILALVSSFLRVEKVPERRVTVPKRLMPPQMVSNVGSQQIVRETPKKVENVNNGANGNWISCPRCKKVFRKALETLDFHGGKNQLVSVCPYCNHILGNTSNLKCAN
jgi:hypothetical protein